MAKGKEGEKEGGGGKGKERRKGENTMK